MHSWFFSLCEWSSHCTSRCCLLPTSAILQDNCSAWSPMIPALVAALQVWVHIKFLDLFQANTLLKHPTKFDSDICSNTKIHCSFDWNLFCLKTINLAIVPKFDWHMYYRTHQLARLQFSYHNCCPAKVFYRWCFTIRRWNLKCFFREYNSRVMSD